MKIAYFRDNIAYISHIFVYFGRCMNFACFVQSQWALRDPRKIFFDKQSETCQKDSSYKKSTDLRRKLDLSKSPNLLTI